MAKRSESSWWNQPRGQEEAATAGHFRTTHWSIVLTAGEADAPGAAGALEQLCHTYWYPLYAYARRQGQRPEDARDLTQQFFASLIQRGSVGLADPERGRFRCFLLASFKNFLANEYHRDHAAKRGGQFTFVSWDEAWAETQYRKEPVCEASPDKLFDQAWALTVLDKVMKELQSEYSRAGKRPLFDALQVFLSGERSETTYARIGERLRMSESAVKMAVLRLRRAYGERLRAEIAHTVVAPGGIEEELRHFVSSLS